MHHRILRKTCNNDTISSYICDLSNTEKNSDDSQTKNDREILKELRSKTKLNQPVMSNMNSKYNLKIVSVEKAKSMPPPPGRGFRSRKSFLKKSLGTVGWNANASECKKIKKEVTCKLMGNFTNNSSNYQYLYEMNGEGRSPGNTDDEYNEPVIIETKNYNNDNIVLEIDVENKMTSRKRSLSRQFELRPSGSIIIVEPKTQDETAEDNIPKEEICKNPMENVFRMANKIGTEQPKNKIAINVAVDDEDKLSNDSDSDEKEGSHGFNIGKVDKVLSSSRKRTLKMPLMKKLPLLIANPESNNSSNSLDTLDDSNLDTSVLTHLTPSTTTKGKQTILCTKCGTEIGCLF
ncbi:hypothetical protein SNEBB_006792 [Seison nebaliae]|nr:hypothetical protein SNEBB_006792 [Seison nebaliae]